MAISREILNGTNNNNGHEVVKPSVPLTVFLEDERAKKVELTGGKGASLAELRTIPEINVPDGFVITTLQSEKILQENPHIVNKIEVLDHHSLNWLRAKLRGDEKDVEFWGRQIAGSGDEAKEEMEKITLAITDENEIRDSYQKLCRKENQENVRVAVRSSGACEDGVEFSFAGQNSTFLHQEGEGEVIKSTIRCLASQFGKRVIQYRNDARFKLAQRALAENPKQSVANALKMSKSFSHIEARLATVVQVMVDGQASGVGFSVDSETGAKIVKLELTCGLGESLVSGSVTPDSYEVDPKTGIILARSLGEKAAKTVYPP